MGGGLERGVIGEKVEGGGGRMDRGREDGVRLEGRRMYGKVDGKVDGGILECGLTKVGG